MSSRVDTGHNFEAPLAARVLRGAPSRWLLAVGLVAASFGCSSDDGGGADATGGAGGGAGAGSGGTSAAGGGGSSEFDACYAGLTPVCKTSELDTEEKMNSACQATEFISIPLTDGSSYGPITTQGGPYGAAVMWNQGAGSGFEIPVNDAEPSCLVPGTGTIDVFGEPASVSGDLKNTRGLDYSLYTVFRPACMKEGETYPVITWANGTCGLTHGYALLLGGVASYGYVVVAPNSTWTNTAPTDNVQLQALDYAAALNEDSSSVFFGKLDLDNIGAMGHSQGAIATIVAGADPRIKALINWNKGPSNDKPFLNVSGDRDLFDGSAAALSAETDGSTQPGAWLTYHQVLETGGRATGHLVLMEQPERVVDLTVAWWDYQLKGDADAKAMFVGADCGLCNSPDEFEYGHNSLLQ